MDRYGTFDRWLAPLWSTVKMSPGPLYSPLPKTQKTEKELKGLIRQRWGEQIDDLTILPGRGGYWNVRALRTKPAAALESQARFEAVIASLREEFDLKAT